MRRWWQDLTDLVVPVECGGCGRPRTVLCAECGAALRGTGPGRVRPSPEPAGLPVVHASARYADQVRAVLLAHKERGALTLARPLGAALAGAVRAGREAGAAGAPVLLVPVPSARRAVRARGHDPVRRIALATAGALRRGGVPARVSAVLRQQRDVADQSGLAAAQRLENLAGALSVARGGERLLAGGEVVLVDDLMTTGASLAEAARAVREAVSPREAVRGRRQAVRGEDAGPAPMPCGGGTPEDGPSDGSSGPAGGAVGPGSEAQAGTCDQRVYAGAGRAPGREQRAEAAGGRCAGRPEGAGPPDASGRGPRLRAAVVAASPDAFETNWN
ncbi:ComF family protein [Streptomyces sp. MS06]|uniref:ComF family protein n=1 Tax=Streptomyces sp. MS06 TaxID=3385974 RepID=UPI0039A1E030